MSPEKTPFRKYYEEFCEVFGHPLWHMPMMLIIFFVGIEVMHTKYHMDGENDAHGFCARQEWVKELMGDDDDW
tara:strand:- start:1035 stop:1253 length:219 start_codon:yes stop_codon:yes gene_type:complete